MSVFEYSVIPSPRKGQSAKGVKGQEAKFANALSVLMNDMGSDGWEYIRADTLPCEERQGLTGKTVKYHSMLVFRRPVAETTAETKAADETLAIEPPKAPVAPEAKPDPELRADPPVRAETPAHEPFGVTEKDDNNKYLAAE